MKLGFIGAGNLGEQAITRLAEQYEIRVADPERKESVKKIVLGYFSYDEVINESNVIFLTVKPNKIDEIFKETKSNLNNKIFISFMAGTSIEKLGKILGNEVKIIRGMPTLGIGTGNSPIAITSNFDIKETSKDLMNLMNMMGRTIEIEEEKFDAFTAILGAGPAYFSFLAKSLSEIAEKEGLSDPEEWINDLLIGTSKMFDEENKKNNFERIMRMVASKGGVTEKALERMESDGFNKIISDAINEAIQRSRELGN